jgi:hypothetical protein
MMHGGSVGASPDDPHHPGQLHLAPVRVDWKPQKDNAHRTIYQLFSLPDRLTCCHADLCMIRARLEQIHDKERVGSTSGKVS